MCRVQEGCKGLKLLQALRLTDLLVFGFWVWGFQGLKDDGGRPVEHLSLGIALFLLIASLLSADSRPFRVSRKSGPRQSAA